MRRRDLRPPSRASEQGQTWDPWLVRDSHELPRALVRGTGVLDPEGHCQDAGPARPAATFHLARRWRELCDSSTEAAARVRRVPRRARAGVGPWEPERRRARGGRPSARLVLVPASAAWQPPVAPVPEVAVDVSRARV